MKSSSRTILATWAMGVLSAGLFCQQAQAQTNGFINGNITWAGGVSLNTSSAGTASQVTAWHSQATPDTGKPEVQSVDGNWASFITVGHGTTFFGTLAMPWSFNSGPIMNFWSVDGFTFNLASSVISSQGTNPTGFVNVTGTGTVSGNNFTPTGGTFRFSTQDPGAGSPQIFSFSASQAVPEGSTVLLLAMGGLCLLGGKLLRRKH